jgi:hypothetical protein
MCRLVHVKQTMDYFYVIEADIDCQKIFCLSSFLISINYCWFASLDLKAATASYCSVCSALSSSLLFFWFLSVFWYPFFAWAFLHKILRLLTPYDMNCWLVAFLHFKLLFSLLSHQCLGLQTWAFHQDPCNFLERQEIFSKYCNPEWIQ